MTRPISSSAHAMARPSRRQDPSIQALRGVAVILMVAGHAIALNGHGDRSGAWKDFYDGLVDIRMPLFTMISGYVYAMVPVARWNHYPELIRSKSRRLLFPLVTIGIALFAADRFTGVVGTRRLPFWHIFVFGFGHLWFLQSLFLIFLVVGALDAAGLLASRTRWSIAITVAAGAFVVVQVPASIDVFTLSGALRLLPFFLLGYGLRRHALFDLNGIPAVGAVALFAGFYTVRWLTIFGMYRPAPDPDRLVAIGVGVTAMVLIYSARHLLYTRLLAWIGSFSFGIYLLHVFPEAISHKVLERLDIASSGVFFVTGLIAAITVPIAFQLVFGRIAVIRTLVLGERITSPIAHFSRWTLTPCVGRTQSRDVADESEMIQPDGKGELS